MSRFVLAVMMAAVVQAAPVTLVDAAGGVVAIDGELRSSAESHLVRGGIAEIPLAEGSTVDVELSADGWWALPATITPAGARLRVWRTGILKGRAAAAKGVELPESFTAYVESPPQPVFSPPIPRGTKFVCPIAKDGTFRCEIPAETLDLAFRTKGLTSHYKWGVQIKPGEQTDLGTLLWKQGASLVVWLDRASAQAVKGEATAALARAAAGSISVEAARLSVPVAEAKFNERGYVQLAPLPAGTYRLSISAPGFSTTSLSPIEIYEGSESVMRKPVVLEPPITVTLAIDPPLDPQGRRWKAVLGRRPDAGAPMSGGRREVVAGDDGTAAFDNQSPGRFHVQIDDEDGNRVIWRDVTITGPADAHQYIAVEQNLVRGKVTLAGEPLEAEIVFGTRDGAERVTMKSDPEGAFQGALPRLGLWPVEVRSEEKEVITLRVVEVERDEELEIRIPDGSISGRVLDSDGNPVPRASVVVIVAPFGKSHETDSRGEFRLRGVGGRTTLMARARHSRAASEAVSIEVGDGAEVGDVILRLVDSRHVRGRVTVAGIPQPGASVSANPAGGGHRPRATTDLDGRFSLPLRESATSATFTVAVAGRTIAAFLRPLTEELLTFDVEPVGGDLVVLPNEKTDRFAIFHNGALLGQQELFEWADAHGGDLIQDDRIVVPSLARGLVRACSHLAGGGEICKDAALVPRGSVTIDLR